MKEKFLVIGGDLRQIACAKRLKQRGFDVKVYGFFDLYLKGLPSGNDLTADLLKADYVLLPLPVSKDGETLNTPLWDGRISLVHLLETVREETMIFGGIIKHSLLAVRNLTYDYAKSEEFLIKNGMKLKIVKIKK